MQLEGEEEAEALAAEGMTQLAASRSAPASSSFGNVADISPLVALGKSLILMSNQIPQEVGACTKPICLMHMPNAAGISASCYSSLFTSQCQ